ncbi:hypothetical protein RhiirB3_417441 [Rhizophagus irregularis]|nr:hypothetical protein RhiirB3_417441 [Rhizophagus irregularis]
MSTSPATVINPVATIIQRFLITKGRFFHYYFDENDSDYNLNYDHEFFYQHYATKYYVRCKLLTHLINYYLVNSYAYHIILIL